MSISDNASNENSIKMVTERLSHQIINVNLLQDWKKWIERNSDHLETYYQSDNVETIHHLYQILTLQCSLNKIMHFSHLYFYVFQLMRLHELFPEVRIQNSLANFKIGFENHFKTFYSQVFFFFLICPERSKFRILKDLKIQTSGCWWCSKY